MGRKGKAVGVSGGVSLAGVRGSAPRTLSRAGSARGIKHSVRSRIQATSARTKFGKSANTQSFFKLR
jgi:hypothetical protein